MGPPAPPGGFLTFPPAHFLLAEAPGWRVIDDTEFLSASRQTNHECLDHRSPLTDANEFGHLPPVLVSCLLEARFEIFYRPLALSVDAKGSGRSLPYRCFPVIKSPSVEAPPAIGEKKIEQPLPNQSSLSTPDRSGRNRWRQGQRGPQKHKKEKKKNLSVPRLSARVSRSRAQCGPPVLSPISQFHCIESR